MSLMQKTFDVLFEAQEPMTVAEIAAITGASLKSQGACLSVAHSKYPKAFNRQMLNGGKAFHHMLSPHVKEMDQKGRERVKENLSSSAPKKAETPKAKRTRRVQKFKVSPAEVPPQIRNNGEYLTLRVGKVVVEADTVEIVAKSATLA